MQVFTVLISRRKQIAGVNWERKRSQTASGARLRALRRRWAQLVSDNYRLERALLQLDTQLLKVTVASSLNISVARRRFCYGPKLVCQL